MLQIKLIIIKFKIGQADIIENQKIEEQNVKMRVIYR